MLRAVRFAGQTGFYIDEETIRAIGEMHENIRKVSAERIQVELVKLMCSEYPQLWETACEQGLCREVLPEFADLMELPIPADREQGDSRPIGTYGQKALQMAAILPADRILRLAALLVYLGKDDGAAGRKAAAEALRRLKFDNEATRKVSALVEFFARELPDGDSAIRRELNYMGEELFFADLALQDAACACVPYVDAKRRGRIRQIRERALEILERGDCIFLKDLQLTGNDLLAAGIGEGKQIGRILKALLECVLEEPELNTPDRLRELAEQIRLKQETEQA